MAGPKGSETAPNLAPPQTGPTLKRSISLPLLVLYGLGTTIGAGIYVLIGATAAEAGVYAPFAFLVSAVIVSLSAASFAELAGRFPVSAGEARYVREGFGGKALPLMVGLMVALSGIVSSATLIQGGAGYAMEFFPQPRWGLAVIIWGLIFFLSAWGISQSVGAAALLTLIEAGGLLLIIGAGLGHSDTLAQRFSEIPFPSDMAALGGILGAGLLAFFAFIGFEDIVNVSEEVKRPKRTVPLAIGLTLLITTLLYMAVATIAVLMVPLDELGGSQAPLSLVFERTTGFGGHFVSAIAITAVLNGVIIQFVMASRVIYGLSRMGDLPAFLGQVHPLTRTPLLATALVAGIVLVLTLFFPLTRLAEATSTLILIIYFLVNLALWRIKTREKHPPSEIFTVPRWLPLLGAVTNAFFLSAYLWHQWAT